MPTTSRAIPILKVLLLPTACSAQGTPIAEEIPFEVDVIHDPTNARLLVRERG